MIVIYNPKSRRRADHLTRAQAIILNHRDAATPVGIVTGAVVGLVAITPGAGFVTPLAALIIGAA